MNDFQSRIFDPELIKRFDVSGPRYTSYPTADRFHEAFEPAGLVRTLRERKGNERPISLYFHIPFCDTVCYYCACNKVITKDRGRADRYLDYLSREMELIAKELSGSRSVAQLHLGGGTPTFLTDAQMRRLFAQINEHFTLTDDGEYSVELDPRRVSRETIGLLAELGLNRMSVGVQDFDPRVQKAVNRIQSVEETNNVIDAARESGFRSVSMDLIYGLPLQTLDSVSATLDAVLGIAPDRIALYNYAHLPTRFMPQRRIKEEELPSADEKLRILGMAIDKLEQAGYVYIGMDHFARPDDEMAIAQREGRLHRNFQGYSTHAGCDLLSFGISAIGMTEGLYTQNVKTLDAYYEALDKGELPVARGYRMDQDDGVRYAVIQSLMCDFALSLREIEQRWGLRFDAYFARELDELRAMAAAGLCEITPDEIRVTERGRLLVRVIAMVFDRHLHEHRTGAKYSKVI